MRIELKTNNKNKNKGSKSIVNYYYRLWALVLKRLALFRFFHYILHNNNQIYFVMIHLCFSLFHNTGEHPSKEITIERFQKGISREISKTNCLKHTLQI